MQKIGILGGGQLGKMLSLSAGNWGLEIWCMDKTKDFPCANYCTHFVEGDFNDYNDVYNFGKNVDVLTIEIEHVNTLALKQLESEGIIINPSPSALEIIKDKGLQKQFYIKNELPTTPFLLFKNRDEILQFLEENRLAFPFVQKARTMGYDGYGVVIINDKSEISKILDTPSIVENLVKIQKEIAVTAAKNKSGEVKVFNPVEMIFNKEANLVEYISSPANISSEITEKAIKLAKTTIQKFDINGLLTVEFFLTGEDELLINEVAPRPHNSGHHTIESCYTSQFEQHLRAILNLPLGSTKQNSPAVMVNLLGSPDNSGQAKYSGIEKCLEIEGVNIHLYSKKMTKPFRKMGHATVLNENLEKAKEIATFVKKNLLIQS